MKTVAEFARHYWASQVGYTDKKVHDLEDLTAYRDAEWRGLVEEAQAETKAIKVRLDALGADLVEVIDERDRLNGELAEALAYVRRVAGIARAVNAPMPFELDAVALVEKWDAAAPARLAQPTCQHRRGCEHEYEILGEAVEQHPIPSMRMATNGPNPPNTQQREPVEQAQQPRCFDCGGPTRFVGKGLYECLGVCKNDPDEAAAEQARPTYYDDGEMRPAPQLNVERLISASPIKAAGQAQGEAAHAKDCERVTHPRSLHPCDCSVAELAKRMEARLDELTIVVTALNEGRRVRDWPAPSASDSTGHAFVPWELNSKLCGHPAIRTAVCAKPECDHLAPPPPESAGPATCYSTSCRYYGQRHATAHEPPDPPEVAAGPAVNPHFRGNPFFVGYQRAEALASGKPGAAGPYCKKCGGINPTECRCDCEPEAAGPGHAFVYRWDHYLCSECGVEFSIHAVPPIPEGT